MYNLIKLHLIFLIVNVYAVSSYHTHHHHHLKREKLTQVFSWKQVGYDIGGNLYLNSSDTESGIDFHFEPEDSDKFFIQYNNVPIGVEKYGDRVFVTIPRRRHGIPSTLNYVELSQGDSSSPLLKPYPDAETSRQLVSVYRPRVDKCGRLWVLDTGLQEVPGDRRQVQPPAIIVFDLETNQQILKYQLKETDLINDKTSAGLTSITIDVTPETCADAYAYINDLATEGLIVFSMKERDSWRINHASFKHEESALNFSVAGYPINWKDGLFSIALSDPDERGKRTAYYHPLVSTHEFAVDTEVLKNRHTSFEGHSRLLGSKGPTTQSGSHDYHGATKTLLYANVAQDAILCWNVGTDLSPDTVAVVAQDHKKLVYISDLKVIEDEVWVLVNQIPRFVYSTLDSTEDNYFIHRGKVRDLIRGTACDRPI